MPTFALIHGAWGSGWHWAGVPVELRAKGHEVVAPDLPIEDPGATFEDYAAVVVDALQDAGDDVVLVPFSLGGHTAPLVAFRRPVREIVYVGALLPEPGMSMNGQFARGDRQLLDDYLGGIAGPDERGVTRWVDFDVYWRVSCHDCSEEVARERYDRSRPQATAAYRVPYPHDRLPDVPSRYVMCADDRLLDNSFWTHAVRVRLGVEPIEIPGSHSPMAARPRELAALVADGLPWASDALA